MNLEKILEVERKYALYDSTIEGVHYWNYSRFGLWNNFILKEHLELGKAHNQGRQGKFAKVTSYWNLLTNSIKFIFQINKQNEICIINHPRKVVNEGYYECVYTEELVKQISNCAVMERPYLQSHLKPSRLSNIQYLDILSFRKMLYYKFYTVFRKNKYGILVSEVESKIKEPLKEIEQVYEIKVNYGKIVKYIVEQIIYYKSNISIVRKIIEQIKPKLLIEVVSYSFDCMMFTEVCKSKKIPVVELQHGTLTNHIAYNYNSEKSVEQIPDKIFLFSEYWKEYVNWPIEKNNISVTGFPHFEKKINEAKKIEHFNDGKINILFISQGTIGKKLSEVAYQLEKILDEDKYRIIYKLHPGEFAIWKEQYPSLANDNILVVDNSNISLYDYFATSQIQIGVYSTALYEGLGFGLETYIYKIELSEQMENLVQKRYVKYFINANDLKNQIEDINKVFGKVEKTEKFWCENALSNTLECIGKIVGER